MSLPQKSLSENCVGWKADLSVEPQQQGVLKVSLGYRPRATLLAGSQAST